MLYRDGLVLSLLRSRRAKDERAYYWRIGICYVDRDCLGGRWYRAARDPVRRLQKDQGGFDHFLCRLLGKPAHVTRDNVPLLEENFSSV
jgi:hypothetical protein